MGIFSKLNLNFETEEVAKLRASTILEGRVDDRDLDRGLELGAQLDELQDEEGWSDEGIQRRGRNTAVLQWKYSRNTAKSRKIAACRIISAC